MFFDDSLVSWPSKRQAIVSPSSAEAEYHGVASATTECSWLRHVLGKLHIPVDKATVIYRDNVSAIYLSENLVHHGRTKHVELDVHFIHEKVAVGDVRVLHVLARQQLADIMTKALLTTLFDDFNSSLNVLHDTQIAGVAKWLALC